MKVKMKNSLIQPYVKILSSDGFQAVKDTKTRYWRGKNLEALAGELKVISEATKMSESLRKALEPFLDPFKEEKKEIEKLITEKKAQRNQAETDQLKKAYQEEVKNLQEQLIAIRMKERGRTDEQLLEEIEKSELLPEIKKEAIEKIKSNIEFFNEETEVNVYQMHIDKFAPNIGDLIEPLTLLITSEEN